MTWNQRLSNLVRTIGVAPYMFIVFAPSLILTIFNIYFNLSVFSIVATSLNLSYGYEQKLKWFVYLSSVLLIMRPLIQQLFETTNGKISKTEQNYLQMMKFVGIGILAVGGLTYIISYLVSDIQVNTYKTIQNPDFLQSLFGLDKEVSGKRSINFFEFCIDICAMFASYFTETLAGFMLITSKDILFPDFKTEQKSVEKKISDAPTREAAEMLIRVKDLSNMKPENIARMLVSKDKLESEKQRIMNFDISNFKNSLPDKENFVKFSTTAIKNIDEAMRLV